MPRILVTPEHLSSVASRFNTAAEALFSLDGQLNSFLANLDMEVRQKSDIDAQVQNSRQRARALGEEAARLGEQLRRTADSFSVADNYGSQALAGLIIRPVDQFAGSIPVSGGGYILPTVLTLAAVPAAIVGVSAGVPGIAGQVEGWVRNLFSRFLPNPNPQSVSQRTGGFGELVTASKSSGTAAGSTSGFGALIEKSQQELPVSGQTQAEPVKMPVVTERSDGQWWADVPVKNQAELRYKGTPTEYGCVPTSASMVMDYWHSQDPSRMTADPQELLTTNENQGQFSPLGMTINQLNDDVTPLGYTSNTFTGSDLATLKAAVDQGPVIAVVHLNMRASGTAHAVVVTGISPSDNQVRINDPWTGKSQTYTWDQFERSWGSSFGKAKDGTTYSTHTFATILPN